MSDSTGHAMRPLPKLVFDNSQPTTNLTLILATVWIIKSDFAVYTSSAVVMGQFAHNVAGALYQNDLVDEVLRRSMNPRPQIKFLIEGSSKLSRPMEDEPLSEEEQLQHFYKYYENREKSIWFLDSMEAYIEFEKDLTDPKRHYHRNGFFLIVYTGMESQRLTNIKEIFRRLFIIYVLNVNVMLMIGKTPYLYTYFPFAKNKCHSSQPEYYASLKGVESDENFTLNKGLFPSKVRNMHGCELRVITWTYAPYIFVDRNEETGELIRLHGIEGSMVTLLAEMMNFKINVIEPNPKDRGEVYANGNATGAAKMILNAEANITIISYMYSKSRSDFMQASYSYLNLPYLLAIPPGGPLTPFQRLIKPFRYIIWSCFSSSLFFAIIFMYILRSLGNLRLMNFIYGRDTRRPLNNLLAGLFGVSIAGSLPHRNFARYLLSVWLMYTFVLRTAYSGQLFLILQDGRARNTMQSLEEIGKDNYTIYAFPAVVQVLEKTDAKLTTAVVDAKNTIPSVFERISNRKSKEKVGLCLLEYSIRWYNQQNPTRRVDILPQPLLTTPIVFYMPHHSYLKYTTADLILEILASGLMKRFESFYMYESAFKTDNRKEPMKLSAHVLLGLFTVYGVFLLLGFVIFMLELCALKSLWARCVMDFLNM